jgi:hypothetical protein
MVVGIWRGIGVSDVGLGWWGVRSGKATLWLVFARLDPASMMVAILGVTGIDAMRFFFAVLI